MKKYKVILTVKPETFTPFAYHLEFEADNVFHAVEQAADFFKGYTEELSKLEVVEMCQDTMK